MTQNQFDLVNNCQKKRSQNILFNDHLILLILVTITVHFVKNLNEKFI